MSFFCVFKGKTIKAAAVNLLILCAVLVVFCTMLFAGGVQNVSKNKKLEPIYRGNVENKNVSLMINVYWGNEFIEDMIKTLKDNGANATFFVGGSWVKQNQQLFKKIVDAGFEIGNHGYLHKDCAKISKAEIASEIDKTNAIIKEITGIDCALFAPPSGSFNQATLELAQEKNLKTIMWSKDTVDWRYKDEALIVQRATKNVQSGDLILMHPTLATRNVLDQICKSIKNQGFNLTCVSDNLK